MLHDNTVWFLLDRFGVACVYLHLVKFVLPIHVSYVVNWYLNDSNHLFRLTAANSGELPGSMYVELDLDFLGIKVLKVWVLVTQEPNKLLVD